MKIENIDRIYISHYTKLTERKEYLSNALSHIENEIVWLESFDREILTDEILQEYLSENIQYDRTDPKVFGSGEKKLNMGEIADTIAHFYAFRQISKDGLRNAIIFEDDIVLLDNFKNINQYLTHLPEDYDIIHIGDYHGAKAKNITPGKYLYPASGGKAGASYIISNRFANEIKDIKISDVLDRFLDTLSSKVYWLEPPVAIQGSKTGKYKSCVR